MTAIVTQFRPNPNVNTLRRDLERSILEGLAVSIAKAAGDIAPNEYTLDSLSDGMQRKRLAQAKTNLADRDWSDAELFARDYLAQALCNRPFDLCTKRRQRHLVHLVHLVTTAAQLYLQGDTCPILAWHRKHFHFGGESRSEAV